MGDKSGAEGFMEAGSAASETAAKLAAELYAETAPYRGASYMGWEKMLGGQMPEAYDYYYGASKAPIEAQYEGAKKELMETIPAGGRLEEELAGLELGKAQSMEQMISAYLTDQLNKMYGAAFGVPQTTLGTMTTVGQQAVETGAATSQAAAGICCFNFLEAEGEIYSSVRRYRDKYYLRTGRVAKGYIRSSECFVPLMRKYKNFKTLIRLTMTKPLKSYAKWYYGENRYGFIFWPIAKGWVNSWWLLGMGVK
jgi:hypothetical protein